MYNTEYYIHTAILKMWKEYGKTHIQNIKVDGTI